MSAVFTSRRPLRTPAAASTARQAGTPPAPRFVSGGFRRRVAAAGADARELDDLEHIDDVEREADRERAGDDVDGDVRDLPVAVMVWRCEPRGERGGRERPAPRAEIDDRAPLRVHETHEA